MRLPGARCRAHLLVLLAVLSLAAAAVVATLGLLAPPASGGPPGSAPEVGRNAVPPALEAIVVRVVDGDTLHVRIGDRLEKVRYIGIDAPELRHPRRGMEAGSREAFEANRELTSGKRVRLELDVRERDRHGRLLAYIWVGNLMVNAELVRRGFAQVMTVPPNVRYHELFLTHERAARATGRGLWRGA